MAKGNDRTLWASDAAERGGKSSIDVLTEWIRRGDNYARWSSGKKGGGVSKETLLREIIAAMAAHGLTHRRTREVRSKMNDLERSVRAAIVWRDTNSAAIVRERGAVAGPIVIQAGMTKICKMFDQIGPVMEAMMKASPSTPFASAAPQTTAHVEDEDDEDASTPQFTPELIDGLVISNEQVQRMFPGDQAVTPIQNPPPSSKQAEPRALPAEAYKRQKTVHHHDVAMDLEMCATGKGVDGRHLAMEEARLRLLVEREQIQVAKEKALARHELRQAGVPEHDIDLFLPLQ